MRDDILTAPDSKESLIVVRKMIRLMSEKFDSDPTGFDYDIETHYTMFTHLDDNGKQVGEPYNGKYKQINVRWRPNSGGASSQYPDIDRIRLTWTPAYHSFNIDTIYQVDDNGRKKGKSENRDFGVGPGFHENMELKKAFVALLRKVEQYYNVEKVRLDNERLVACVYDMFPELLDMELLDE